MSDLYHETSETGSAEADTDREPAYDAGSLQQYEAAEPADHSYGEYTETDTEVQAKIAGQDELPTPEESRQATWGDNPDYYDETESGAEYDGDVDAFLAGEDELPTPQESRARTWGDNPEYYDETDLASEYDGDLDALTAEDHALDGDTGDQDQAAARDAAPAVGRPDDPTAEAPDGSAAVPAEHPERTSAEANERITELEARLERLEHAKESEPSTGITGQERDTAQQDTARTPKEGRWQIPSDEGLALGAAAAGGVITTVSDYFPYLHADVAGITASAVAVGAAAVTYMRARREGKHARRTKD